jgi:integrase
MSRRTFGSTRKLPSGQWQASYWHEGARHVAPWTFETKADAARWLSATHNDLSRGQWFDPRRAQVRFDEWADSWTKNVVDLRPSTFARDKDYLNRYIIPVFGELPLGDISVGRIRTWITDLNASGLAPATVVKAGQILSKVLRSAVEEGVMATNPCSAVRLPRVERTEMRYLSPAEVSRLADAIDPRYRAVVLLGAYGGLRAGELFGLRFPRLDLPAQRLDVVEQVIEVSGNLHFGAPKTKVGSSQRSAASRRVRRIERTSSAVAERRSRIHRSRRRTCAPGQLAVPLLQACRRRRRRGTPARPRSPSHRCLSVDRRRRITTGDRFSGRTHVGVDRPRPLRTPLARKREPSQRRPRPTGGDRLSHVADHEEDRHERSGRSATK